MAAVRAGVDDEAVTAVEVMSAGQMPGFGEKAAEEGGIFGEGVGVGGNVALGDKEQVGRSLWVDVCDSENLWGFVEALDGDGAGDNLAEKAVGVGLFWHVGYGTRAEFRDSSCRERVEVR